MKTNLENNFQHSDYQLSQFMNIWQTNMTPCTESCGGKHKQKRWIKGKEPIGCKRYTHQVFIKNIVIFEYLLISMQISASASNLWALHRLISTKLFVEDWLSVVVGVLTIVWRLFHRYLIQLSKVFLYRYFGDRD